MEVFYRVRAELSKNALLHNIDVIDKKVDGKAKWIAVVKSNAYGHGVRNLVPILEEKGVFGYAVATVEEGLEVRELIQRDALILVLGYTHPSQYEAAIRQKIALTIYTLDQAKALSKVAVALGQEAKVHIKLETGMGRIGFALDEAGFQDILAVSCLSMIQMEGIFTHFSRSDEADRSFAAVQLERFMTFLHKLEEKGLVFPLVHTANSAAIMEFPQSFSMPLPSGSQWLSRAGIMLYGLYPSKEMDREVTPLKPVMTVKSHIVHIKDVPAGTPIGYGGTFVTKRPSRIATVPIGYGDGYPRHLSNLGFMLVGGKKAPIAGRVCMDQTMLDITDLPDAQLLDEVEVFGKELSVDTLADLTGTISYEIICQLTDRTTRVLTEEHGNNLNETEG